MTASPLRPLAASAPAMLLLLVASSAVADEIDLSSLADLAQVRSQATSGELSARYARLASRLTAPDVPGLVDDLKRLRRAAAACDGHLKDDGALCDALVPVLDAAQARLVQASASLVQRVADLESPADRARCGGVGARGKMLADRSLAARFKGRYRTAVLLQTAAARAYEQGETLAGRLLDAQDHRPPAWSAPLTDLGGALLSVWAEPGSSPAVYTVGADDGSGPLFLLTRGEGWVRLPTPQTSALWWVSGVGDGVWAVGTNGTALRYEPATGTVESRPIGIDATMYGIWGATEDDVWAVGGNVDGTLPRTVLAHWNGSAWTDVPAPPEATNKTLFKVWGSSASDVWVCGQGGLILHYDGATWQAQPSGSFESLFTVHGEAPTIAVGGAVQPTISERGIDGWVSVTAPPGSETLRGVFVPKSGNPIACGMAGTVLQRSGGTWRKLSGLPATSANDFHAVFVDDRGGTYVVGGDLVRLKKGVLLHYGPRKLPSGVFPQAKFSTQVVPLFTSTTCAVGGCHVAATPGGELDMFVDPHTLQGRLVGVPSSESPLLRVLPGRPSQSYLWHKLNGTHRTVGGSGDRMPQSAPPLSQDVLDRIRAWILEGARDD